MTCFNNYVYIIFTLQLFIPLQLVVSHYNNYNNTFGDNYGVSWIYFPDEHGTSHYVSLFSSDDDFKPPFRGKDNMKIKYTLYTGKNIVALDESGDPINKSINMTTILKCKPLKIITHGWRSSSESPVVMIIAKAYLETQNVNVITIDWSGIAGSLLYHWVVKETRNVGSEIAKFLNKLKNDFNVCGNQMHLIGHSLGAHVLGIAASEVNFTISRITGLDPAKPLFENVQGNSGRLDSGDAKFVDVIHTCGGVLGYLSAIGTVDFYPNNGVPPQQGCELPQEFLEYCSHARAFYYFEESIRNPTAFLAYQCRNWEEFLLNQCNHYHFMGDAVSKNISGTFYLKTNPSKPFGRNTKAYEPNQPM